MTDPFFSYIHTNRETISRSLYGLGSGNPKKYERFPSIQLPRMELDISKTFAEVLLQRTSDRRFSKSPLSLTELGGFLYWSIAAHADTASEHGFLFPSGGSMYAMETYLIVRNVAGIDPGIYHYHPLEHTLTNINRPPVSDEDMHFIISNSANSGQLPQVFICMTMVKERIIQKYGALSYLLAIAEAGHRGQAMYLSAAALDLACCASGTTDYERINPILGIDGMNEHHVYGLMLGKV